MGTGFGRGEVHGEPSRTWVYRVAAGHVVGYVCRWDFTNEEGRRRKQIRPVCYCDLGNGRRAWRSVGMPAPRPLLGLLEILARPDARVMVVEGEKTADAAAKLFPELVATTPPHWPFRLKPEGVLRRRRRAVQSP